MAAEPTRDRLSTPTDQHDNRPQLQPVSPSPEQTPRSGRSITLQSATTIIPRQARFLWDARIPLGALTILAGPPGLGKTTLSMWLAAAISRGTLPGELAGQGANVVYASAEDSPETTLVPRFLAAEGDPVKLHLVKVTEGAFEDSLTLPDDIEQLHAVCAQDRTRLIVLDPVVAYLADHVNAHKDQHVRRVLAPLAALAADLELAVVAIMHLNKGEGRDLLARIGGSVGFGAAARSALFFARDPDDPEGEDGGQRIIAHAKSNLGPKAPAIYATVEPATVHVDGDQIIGINRLILGREANHSSADLLDVVSVGDATARGDAKVMLFHLLDDGPVTVREIREAADAHGLAWRTVERAKSSLGVRAVKTATHWEWKLPDESKAATSDAHQEPKPTEDRHPYGTIGGLVGLGGLDPSDHENTAKTAKAATGHKSGGLGPHGEDLSDTA